MEFVCLGWPPDGPTLRLDYRRFAYAGKFVTPTTGKAVVPDPGADGDGEYDTWVLAAASFDPDRSDAARLRVRYVTVRKDRQGEGLGSRLLAFVAARAEAREYDRVAIAVNNPVAYRAAHRAGFWSTGEETGLAELVCERPGPRDPEIYRDGLEHFRDRDLGAGMADVLDDPDPPAVIEAPAGTGTGTDGSRTEPGG
jgi:GNAT superfamily N-acetyltransferase